MSTRPIRRSVVAFSVILLASWVAPSGAQEPARREAPQAPTASKKDPAEALKSLEQALKEYAEDNAALRKRVRELESEVAKLKQNRTVTVVPQPGATGQVPENWRPFQFNGATYYVVPLAANQPNGRAGRTAAIEAETALRTRVDGEIRAGEGTIRLPAQSARPGAHPAAPPK